MAASLDGFTMGYFNRRLREFAFDLAMNVAPSQRPQAELLGGQSGAGKTRLHDLLKVEFNQNAIVINGDEYRRAHPNFSRIQQRYGVDAPAHTAKWAGQMTEALIDALSAQGYNLVIEGTLRTSDVPLRTAALLHGRGYSVSLAVMAVKPEMSLVSCQIRYEMMRIAGTAPRATDPAHHDKIVHDIVDNLEVLEQSGVFDAVRLFNRAGECLYPNDVYGAAAQTLKDVLFGPWTEEERGHFEFLQQKLAELRER